MIFAPPATRATSDVDGHLAAPASRDLATVPPGAGVSKLQRLTALTRRIFSASYSDPLFERPELVEDDYCRFRNQPRGY